MELLDKLRILAEGAKYDVSCTSSGVDRKGKAGQLGNAVAAGICHSFSADGRCISLLKILLTNHCIYDCKYCVNRRSYESQRVAFTPEEVADLTMNFYRRNYIEGLFLSSGVWKNPDYTMEQMIQAISLLRNKHKFNGYIHVKAIPGADPSLITGLGYLVDRMSINLELPSEDSLKLLAPQKNFQQLMEPVKLIEATRNNNQTDLVKYRHAPKFVPGGQSTQLIIGATKDSDYNILQLSQRLYEEQNLKRVFFSAYTPLIQDPALPSLLTPPPLQREHRLYQADWLLRFYHFKATDLLDPEKPWLHLHIDPKLNWALNHLDCFPMEMNQVPYESLVKVPGIGLLSAKRILQARKWKKLDFSDLKKMGISLKRSQYFILCNGKNLVDFDQSWRGLSQDPELYLKGIGSGKILDLSRPPLRQMSLLELVNQGMD